MRLLFLIPEYSREWPMRLLARLRRTRLNGFLSRPAFQMRVHTVFGGTLNLMRHCALAREAGFDACLATVSGRDTYGERRGPVGWQMPPTVAWRSRRVADVCVIPDFLSRLVSTVRGPVIAYQQVPLHTRADFDHTRSDLQIWTDSPLMEEHCRALYPGKPIRIVPNIVDSRAFPFRPQSERQSGELVAFPRKGPEFIDATFAAYQRKGGSFWQLHKVDGLDFRSFVDRMQTPQAFLASAVFEGCALPPQECMSAGIAVIGRDARGANFCMQHERTALVANDPESAAEALLRAEDHELRDAMTRRAAEQISEFFPEGRPKQFWQEVLAEFGGDRTVRAEVSARR